MQLAYGWWTTWRDHWGVGRKKLMSNWNQLTQGPQCRPVSGRHCSEQLNVSALCLCCFLAHRLLYGIFVALVFRSCFPCHTNPWGHTMLSSLLICFKRLWTDQLIIGRAGFWCVFWVFLYVLFGFWVFVVCFSVFARWQLNGLCIEPFQFSFVLYANRIA